MLENDGYKAIDEKGNTASIPVTEQRLRAMKDACERGYVDLATELHELGVDIVSNTELLRIAADAHQHEIAAFLIQMGADVNGRSETIWAAADYGRCGQRRIGRVQIADCPRRGHVSGL